MSDDPKQDYLADGLAEEIINSLSKLSNVFVIARNSSFSYKGRQVKVQQVAEELELDITGGERAQDGGQGQNYRPTGGRPYR